MSQHVIVGAGAVGTATARILAERGDRSGSSPAAGPARSTRRSSASPPTRPTPTA